MKSHLLIVGDEILIGQVLDTNSNWMAQKLNLNGIQVEEIRAVRDTKSAIEQAVSYSLEHADLVLMTGGLGPTKDDITKKTLAELFGMKLEFHQESFDNLGKLFAKFNRTVGDEFRNQCAMPVGAVVLRNEVGTAPGMWFERGTKVLVSMPGVPFEMKWLMENAVLPRLKEKYPSSPIVHKTILTVAVGETQLSDMLTDFEAALPENVKLAYLPYLGGVRLRLTARGENESGLQKQLKMLTAQMLPIIGDAHYGFEEDTLESVIGDILKSKNATLATAESCTGGFIAHRITSISGSSEYFLGSVVSYSNELKMKLLDVKKETLDTFGAVSEQTVQEMLSGCLKQTGATYAIAISGIAGPGGGTPEKPVGTVVIGIADKERQLIKTVKFGRERKQNIEMASTTALNLLRKFLM